MQYSITLGFPCSVNTFYTIARGRKILSTKGREYQADSLKRLKSELGEKPHRLTGRLRLYIGLSRGDYRDYDIDNFQKCVQDVLTGVCYVDDSQIDEIRVLRLPVSESGYAEVIIEQLSKKAPRASREVVSKRPIKRGLPKKAVPRKKPISTNPWK